MHIVEIGGGGDQDKCVLVSWSPLIHPTTLTDGLFPDFIVTLVGIQADEGEPWVFYYITDIKVSIGFSSFFITFKLPLHCRDTHIATYLWRFIERNGWANNSHICFL